MRKQISVAKYNRAVKYHPKKWQSRMVIVDAEFIVKCGLPLNQIEAYTPTVEQKHLGDRQYSITLSGVFIDARDGDVSGKVYWYNPLTNKAWILRWNGLSCGYVWSVNWRMSRPWNLILLDRICSLNLSGGFIKPDTWRDSLPNKLLTGIGVQSPNHYQGMVNTLVEMLVISTITMSNAIELPMSRNFLELLQEKSLVDFNKHWTIPLSCRYDTGFKLTR